MNLAFALDAASWWGETDISTLVRKILAKCSPLRYGAAACTGGPLPRRTVQVTAGDKKMRAVIFKKNPNRKTALSQLINIGISIGFKGRQEYFDYIVAAANAHTESAREKTRSQRSVGELICALRNSETIELQINNERIRKEIAPPILEYMAAGTTGVEALGAELKHWFVGVNHLHAPIVRLNRRVPHVSKLLTFRPAMYDRTDVQIRQSFLLARVWRIGGGNLH